MGKAAIVYILFVAFVAFPFVFNFERLSSKAEAALRQAKEQRDLGGDINVIGKLNFRGNEYTLFVNADANLESIYTNLHKLGEPIDDISFIKIAYIASEDKIEEKQIDLALIRSMVKNSNYRAALEELESTEEEILGAEFIYLRTLCLERIGLGTVALSILEKHPTILNNYLPAEHLKALIYYRAEDVELENFR